MCPEQYVPTSLYFTVTQRWRCPMLFKGAAINIISPRGSVKECASLGAPEALTGRTTVCDKEKNRTHMKKITIKNNRHHLYFVTREQWYSGFFFTCIFVLELLPSLHIKVTFSLARVGFILQHAIFFPAPNTRKVNALISRLGRWWRNLMCHRVPHCNLESPAGKSKTHTEKELL